MSRAGGPCPQCEGGFCSGLCLEAQALSQGGVEVEFWQETFLGGVRFDAGRYRIIRIPTPKEDATW